MFSIGVTNFLLIAAAALTGIGVVLFAVLYIRAATALRQYFLAQYPSVAWDKPSGRPFWPYHRSAWRLTALVGGRQSLEAADPVYRSLSAKARLWAVLWLMSLPAFILALGFLTTPR